MRVADLRLPRWNRLIVGCWKDEPKSARARSHGLGARFVQYLTSHRLCFDTVTRMCHGLRQAPGRLSQAHVRVGMLRRGERLTATLARACTDGM